MRICIDPGHGGHDSGAVAPDGTREKDIVLRYANALGNRLLRVGHGVLLTRASDDFVGLSERAEIANDWGADCLISLHANAASDAAANGAWVIYDDRTTTEGGIGLADSIFRQLAQIPGIADTDPEAEVYADATPWVGGRNLAVVSRARMPAVLVELGFLTNPDDLAQLLAGDTLREVVDALARGILEWGGEADDPMPDVPEPVVELVGTDWTPARLETLEPVTALRSPVRAMVEATAEPDEPLRDWLCRISGWIMDEPGLTRRLPWWLPPTLARRALSHVLGCPVP